MGYSLVKEHLFGAHYSRVDVRVRVYIGAAGQSSENSGMIGGSWPGVEDLERGWVGPGSAALSAGRGGKRLPTAAIGDLLAPRERLPNVGCHLFCPPWEEECSHLACQGGQRGRAFGVCDEGWPTDGGSAHRIPVHWSTPCPLCPHRRVIRVPDLATTLDRQLVPQRSAERLRAGDRSPWREIHSSSHQPAFRLAQVPAPTSRKSCPTRFDRDERSRRRAPLR